MTLADSGNFLALSLYYDSTMWFLYILKAGIHFFKILLRLAMERQEFEFKCLMAH